MVLLGKFEKEIFFKIGKQLSRLLELDLKYKKIIIIFTDLVVLFLSSLITIFIVYPNFYAQFSINIFTLPLTSTLGTIIFIFFKQYKEIVRYTSGLSIHKSSLKSLIAALFIYLINRLWIGITLSNAYWVCFWLILSFGVGAVRLIFSKAVKIYSSSYKNRLPVVAIYGAGSAGSALAMTIEKSNSHTICTFIDDAPIKWGRSLNGINIISPSSLKDLNMKIDQILVAIPSLSIPKRKILLKSLEYYNIPVLQIPSIKDIASGKSTINNLRPISIEQLLGRQTVPVNPNLFGTNLTEKVVCVIGAGGSIGTEICLQLLKFNIKSLILIERSEENLYNLNAKIINLNDKKLHFEALLGDACNLFFLEKIFLKYKIDIIFHAAAYKHVPIVENNPLEGIFNNVFSTYNICVAAQKLNLEKVVFISTDKCVRPTNVMGASKRLAELIVQGFSKDTDNKNKQNSEKFIKTIFSMVRFGNVLGSSGSVVPLFKKQIAEGGPITITDFRINRYFMTIEEAAQLVIQSSSLSKGGEVFLLDMGSPILIYELAKKMIFFSGLRVKDNNNPNGDIEIIQTGLRPGEKLFEELLIDSNSQKTYHNLIFKATEKSIDPHILFPEINKLREYILNMDKKNTLMIMKKLVPEWQRYILNTNSEYSV